MFTLRTIGEKIIGNKGNYVVGEDVDIFVEFTEPVYVQGIPGLDSTHCCRCQKCASYVSGDGTNRLLFRYTVKADDWIKNLIILILPL